MGFLSAIASIFGDEPPARDDDQRTRLARAWDIGDKPSADTTSGVEAKAQPTGGVNSAYDERMWANKLRHLITEKVPVPEDEWQDFLADAIALGFDPAWIERQKLEAFELLIRRIVADGVVTADEHHTMELARIQIGLTDEDAEQMLRRVVVEARQVLGQPVRGV